ncbi:MAG: hypothetical protein ACKN9U_22410, partial [Pirellulaceae bacterium]
MARWNPGKWQRRWLPLQETLRRLSGHRWFSRHLGTARRKLRIELAKTFHERIRAPRRPHLMIEGLESRQLLAVAIWDGGSGSQNWSQPSNWVGDIAPNSGDQIVFPPSGSYTYSFNDLSGFQAASISIQGDGYEIFGEPIVLLGDLTITGTSGVYSLETTLSGSGLQTISVVSSPGENNSYEIFTNIDLNGRNLRLAAFNEGLLRVTGAINGDGNIFIPDLQGGEVNIYGDHSYIGDLTVQSGGRLTLAGSYPQVTVQDGG